MLTKETSVKHLIRAILILTAALGLATAGSKIAPDVPQSNANATVDVIVQYKTPPSKNELKQLGPYGQIKKQYSVINGINITLSVGTIQALALDPNILYISPNRKSKGAVDISTATVNTGLVWSYGFTGTGVGVAVIDSGMNSKSDFNNANGTSRIVYSESLVAGLDASDQYGHGTHVAGIVGGDGANSTGPAFSRTFKGVAPNVNLIDLRVLDQNGSGNESDVIAGIQRAVDLKDTYGIRVINLSLGHPVYESYTLDPLCQAVESAWRAGIVVVVAAGNYGRDNSMGTKGYGTIASPGNDPLVITVGATNAKQTASPSDDSIATYSSKGPTLIDHIVKPDLVAPGNAVVSTLASPNCTLAANYPSTRITYSVYESGVSGNSVDYLRLSGTSMATPVVSGAAALLIQKNPSLTPDQIKARLMKTARKILPSYMSGYDRIYNALYMNQADIFTVGAGYLDIFAALQNNDLTTQQALSPRVSFNASSHRVTVTNILWGDNIVWDEALIWGTSVFNGTLNGLNILWGDNIVWGDTTTSGFNIIWDESTTSSAMLQASDYDDGDQDQ
jgi:serine protease AprX